MNDLQKRTWAEVSLGAIENNYKAIRKRLPEGCKFLGIVKADAYGHGACEVAKRLEQCGADYLAIACLDEAIELRRSGVRMPVLILGHTPPEYVSELLRYDLTQTVSCEAKATEFSEAAGRLGGTLKIHIKLDTGMSRLGFLCAGGYFDEGVKNVVRTCNMPNLDVEGIYTHFAVSDYDDAESIAYTKRQFKLFCDVISAAEAQGVHFKIRHCANSGAVVNHPEMMLDMVRPGLLLYGYGDGGKLGLRPAMRLVSTVSTIEWASSQRAMRTDFRGRRRESAAFTPREASFPSAAISAWICAWSISPKRRRCRWVARSRYSAKMHRLRSLPRKPGRYRMSCCAQSQKECREYI